MLKLVLLLACPVLSFHWQKMKGKWFELARTRNLKLEQGDHVEFHIDPRDANNFLLEYFSNTEPKAFHNRAVGVLNEDTGKYQITVTNNFLTRLFTFNVEVVDTDYTSYAIIHSKTTFFWFYNHVCAWILTRTPKVDANLENFLVRRVEEKLGIKKDELYFTEQTPL